jgi:hypothetical protein
MWGLTDSLRAFFGTELRLERAVINFEVLKAMPQVVLYFVKLGYAIFADDQVRG